MAEHDHRGVDALTKDLRDTEERTRLILDTALDAVVAMDSHGRISDWNRQAEVIFGWRKEEVLGRSLSETIVPSHYREAHERGLTRFLATGEAKVLGKRLELMACRRDGDEFPVELAIAPPGTVNGQYIFSAFIRDISERRRTDEELKHARQRLEQQNQTLEAALRDARAAAQAKSAFLATMSHEIRTPMHGILSMTSFLLDTSLDSEQREYADTVKRCGESLLAIINDILDFSKMEAGKLSLEHIPFRLRETIEDVLQMFATTAEEKRLELGCLMTATVPGQVEGDPGRLRQILVNLVGNAIKFTERGDVLVHVSRQEERDDAVLLRIAVTDTGPGISEDVQARLFQPFSQGDTSTTRRYGGTGLGLAICKHLVELIGGQIGIDSTPGSGSTFWFVVPFGRAAVEAGERPGVQLRGRRFCIVDDNATNRRILENHCRTWGADYISVESGAMALEVIRRAAREGNPFDVAVIDLQMPHMDGLELARHLRQDGMSEETRLVLLTSVGMRGEAERAREAGFCAYLMKPVREAHLYECLTTVLAEPWAKGVTRSVTSVPKKASSSQQRPTAVKGPILVAEDNVINQKVAVRMLQQLGHRVDVVATGQEAVAAVGTGRYVAVLMDCRMPDMDGYTATAHIRKTEDPGRHVPIIAMTADAMREDRERCLAAGMDDYIAKPVALGDLERVLARWLTPDDASQPAARTTTERLVDDRVLAELEQLDATLLPSLLAEFLEEVPRRVRDLRDALGRSDWPALAELAHALKGSCGNLGAETMKRLSHGLQEAGQAQEGPRAARLLDELEEAFRQSRPLLALRVEPQPKDE